MIGDYEKIWLESLLGKAVEPNEEFWKKAHQYGFSETWWAIRKASQEGKKTIEHITNLIGNVVKEGDVLMYRSGVNPNDL